MSFPQQVTKFLAKPYPDEEEGYAYYRYLILVSLFIAIFLYIFQPFGIDEVESQKLLVCLGFGSMTFLGVFIYDLTVVKLQRAMGVRDRWTFGKWMLNNIGVVFFISMANFLFIRIFFFGFIQWELFPAMLYGTFMVGLIPFTILGGIGLLKAEKKYAGIANEINQQTVGKRRTAGSQQLSVFGIPAVRIRYVEALQNYVKIGYLDADDQLQEQTERGTLKGVLEIGAERELIKCHRSFLVNRAAIVSTSGNAQGLLLTLDNCDKLIPVARSYVPEFR